MSLLLPGEPGHEVPATERRIVLNELDATRKLKSALDQSQPIGDRARPAADAASLLGTVKSDQIRLRQLQHEESTTAP